MSPARALLLIGLLVGCARVPQSGTSGHDQPPAEQPPDGARVTAEDIERTPSQPIERLLSSRFASVIVTRSPGGGLAIRIRGATSIYGSTEPLFVIDGFPIEPGPGGALFGINPYDIESIEVVTDPAGTALYGVRGANGVIIIKTKQPQRPDY